MVPFPSRNDPGLCEGAAPVMIRRFGVDKRCISFSDAWLEFTGRTMEQEAGQGWLQGVCPDDVARCMETLEMCFDERRLFRMEYRLRRRDGRFRWILETGAPEFGDGGAFRGYSGFCVDIHDLKMAAESLRDSESRYRTLFETTQDGILIVNDAGRYIDVNKALCEILKATREQLVGAHFSAFIPPGRLAEAERAFSSLRKGGPTPLDFPLRALDGSVVELEWSSAADYRPGIYFCVCRDVTARKKMEASSLHLASIVESSGDAIVSKDLNGIITSWNKAAERMFGYTEAEAVGRPVSMLAPPGKADEMSSILDRIRQGERIEHYETVRRTKDGVDLAVSVTISPIRDKHGRIIGASKIARDITKQKEAQLELRAANAALRRVNERLRDFAYVAGHDLREPMRTVSVYSELLAKRYRGKLDPEADQFLTFTEEGAKHVQALLNSLIALTQANEAPDQTPEPVACNDAVQAAIENLRAAIEESGAEITVEDLPVVQANQDHLVQVFQNLIANAIKYRRPDVRPKIHIWAKNRAFDWLLSVKDNGIGIDPKYQDIIFEAFKRLHKDEYPGTGMGLAICARLVERYGGAIWVNSEPGQGATFCFTVPKKRTD